MAQPRIVGAAAPQQFIAAMMGKQKSQPIPYNRANIVRPFNPQTLTNPSRDIQRKYLAPPAALKPYDACKAQQRRQEAIEEGAPAADPEAYSLVSFMLKNKITSVAAAVRRYYEKKEQECDVMKPEFWGLRMEDLQPRGNYFVNADGLRFPPIQWRDPITGQRYWGLAAGGPGEDSQRNRYTMMYFKEGTAPDIDTQFKETAAAKKLRQQGIVMPPLPEKPQILEDREELERREAARARGELPLPETRWLPGFRARIAADLARPENQAIIDVYEAVKAQREALKVHASRGTNDVKNYRGVVLEGTDKVKARPAAAVAAAARRKGRGPQLRANTLTAEQRRKVLTSIRKGINRYKEENPNAGRCPDDEGPPPLEPAGPMPQLVVNEVEPEAAAMPQAAAAAAVALPPLDGQPERVYGPLPADEAFTTRDTSKDGVIRRHRAHARAVRVKPGEIINKYIIRDAYNAAGTYGTAPLVRVAYALGVPPDKKLDGIQRQGIFKAIMKARPELKSMNDKDLGALKAYNGDFLSFPDPGAIPNMDGRPVRMP